MDFMYTSLLIESVLAVLVVVALVHGLRLLRRSIGGAGGGWAALATRYAVAEAPSTPIAAHASVMIGRILWRNCVVVGVERRGLRLAVKVPLLGAFGKPPLLIPWGDFGAPEEALLHWQPADRHPVGHPPITTLTVPRELEQAIVASGHRFGVG